MKKILLFPAALWLLTACVTINIYFPAAQAEKAADRIVGEILGEPKSKTDDKKATQKPGLKGEKGALRLPLDAPAPSLAVRLLDLLIPAARAAPNFSVDTPEIRRLKVRMKQRNAELRRYYASGAIGFTADGRVAMHDAKAVSLRERNRLKQLIRDENADRVALYRAIARANGHPEWESDVRAVFARKWIEKAGPGWWYQTADGRWRRK